MEFTEYRGIRKLCFAEITKDDGTDYTTSTWKRMAGIQSVGNETEESSETHYYDNQAAIVVDAEGADTVTMTTSAPPNDVKAVLDGVGYDETKDMIINIPKKRKYYAIGYIGEKTDGTEEAVIHYKGKFGGGSVSRNTKDNGTETTNLEYTFTGIHTSTAIYTEGGVKKPAKSITVPLSETLTEDKIFGVFTGDVSAGDVLTPDEIKALS